MTESDDRIRILLLRHGRVAHHRGDVPLTELGVAQAEAAGEWFAKEGTEVACLLSGETRRTRDTAEHFAASYRRHADGLAIPDPIVSFALRNPDLYLGGHRINMGQGAPFLASQSPEVTEADVERSPFYAGLMTADDRVGFWIESNNVPGDSSRDVGRRIDQFARSLGDVAGWWGRTIVAITHSPVLRAVRLHLWGEYSKEPPFLHGYSLTLARDGGLELATFTTDTGEVPTTSRPGAGNEKL